MAHRTAADWKRVAIITLIGITALLIWMVWQRHKAEQEAEKQREFDEARDKVAAFAERRGAVANWQKGLGGAAGLNVYTADLQPQLVRVDGRPVLLYGRVLDI